MQIRLATLADRDAAMRIAAAGLLEFGVTPDFDLLDRDVALIGATSLGVAPLEGIRIALVAVTEAPASADSSSTESICGCVVVVGKDALHGKLSGFYVAPEQRGKGIGRALLKAATDAARAAGLCDLHLFTWGKMHSAVALYEATGWQRMPDPSPEEGADRAYHLALT